MLTGALTLLVTGGTIASLPLAAQATDVLFADAVPKPNGGAVTSQKYTNIYGGKVKAHVGSDGWVNATGKGETQKYVGSSWYLTVSFSGDINAWGGYSGVTTPNGRNVVWWTFPGATCCNYPISGKLTF